MRRPAQNKISLVCNPHGGIEQRLFAVGQAHLDAAPLFGDAGQLAVLRVSGECLLEVLACAVLVFGWLDELRERMAQAAGK